MISLPFARRLSSFARLLVGQHRWLMFAFSFLLFCETVRAQTTGLFNPVYDQSDNRAVKADFGQVYLEDQNGQNAQSNANRELVAYCDNQGSWKFKLKGDITYAQGNSKATDWQSQVSNFNWTFTLREVPAQSFTLQSTGALTQTLNQLFTVRPDDLTSSASGPVTYHVDVIGNFPGGVPESSQITFTVEFRCQPPNGAQANSVHVSFDLATPTYKMSGAMLRLEREGAPPATPLASRSALTISGVAELSEILPGGHPQTPVRQIIGRNAWVDLVDLPSGETGYTINYYLRSRLGAKVGGFYTSTGAPYKTVVVEHPANNLNILRISRAEPAGATVIQQFEWSASDKNWTLKEGDSLGFLRTHRLVETTSGVFRTQTRTISRDGINDIVSVVEETYRRYDSGERLIKSVEDPAGLNLTTHWEYYDSSLINDPGYTLRAVGQLKTMRGPDGRWESYTYEPLQGRLAKRVSSFGNSPLGDETVARVETITYATSNPLETRVTTIAGQEVRREFLAKYNGNLETHTIVATVPGAAWNAATNLVTKTILHAATDPYPFRLKRRELPDGTVELHAYTDDTDGTRHHTIKRGAPHPSVSTDIAAGTIETTTTNPWGRVIYRSQADRASGLTLFTETATDIDDLGRPVVFTYGDGTTRSLVYRSAASCGCSGGSDSGTLASETDRNGVETTYDYDVLERRTHTTRSGVTEKVIYDAADRVVETHRIGTGASDIRLSKTTYDLAGRVTATEDALGHVTTTAYSYPFGGGLSTTTTLPATAAGAGTRIETTYADGRVKEVSGTAVSPIKYAYGTWSATGQAGEWTQEIKIGESSAETEWTKTYSDLAGRTVKMEYPTPVGTVAATMTYNALGQLEKQTDPDGVAMLYAYNTKGEREVTALDLDQDGVIDYTGTDRITKTTTDVYSRSGTIVRRATTQVWTTDASNTTTTVAVTEQDGYGNLSWQKDAATAEGSSVIARTAAGAWTVTITAPDGSQQLEAYTSGRLDSATRKNSAGGQVTKTSYAYDSHNRVETQTDARTGDTDYTYTDRDEVLTVTANNGTETTTNTYDALGNQLTLTRPDASVTTNEYHLRNNQLKKTYGSQTYPVEYTYDLQGRMKTLTTWQNATSSTGAAVTTWNYDAQRGWLTQKLYADNTGPSYIYTPAGRLFTRTWARISSSSLPLITTYGYTSAGDLASTDYSDTTPDVAMTYTRFGAQKTVTDVTGTRTFTYTTALRPDQEQLAATYYGSRILTRTYETSGATIGRSTGFTLGVTAAPAQDHAVTYGYDPAGRLATVTDPASTYTYGYTTNSNLRHTVTGPVHVATTTYEPYRNVIDTVENKVGTNTMSKFDYVVNNLGQRTQRANTGTAFGSASTDVFTYNTKGEVESATNATLTTRDQSFAYDDIGNRKTFTQNSGTTNYTANNLNAYTAIGGASPTHDEDGNQTSTGLGQVYVWDAENRLVIIEPVVPTTGDKKQLNVYDAQSRRVRKQVSTYASGSWSLTTDEKFIYDGWNLVAVLNAVSSDALLRTYTWGTDLSGSMQGAGGVGGLLSAKDGSFVYYYTYDANGNVSEVLNYSGGIAAHYEYDAFGNTVTSSGTYASTNVYRFSTKPLDLVSELYYYGFRYYNPNTGRWPSRDPIAEKGGLNLYGMLGNNAVSGIDNLGMSNFVACADLLIDIIKHAAKIFKELDKYDPVSDAIGGHPHKYGVTRPFGHYDEIKDLQRGLKNRLGNFVRSCIDDDDPPGPDALKYPRWADQLSNASIPRLKFVYDNVMDGLQGEWSQYATELNSIRSGIASYSTGDIYLDTPVAPNRTIQVGTDDVVKGVAVVGGCYVAYRVIRFAPSLLPPLWWTAPANLALP